MTEVTQSSFKIKLDFAYPELIGSEKSTQYLTIKLKFSDFEPLWDDYTDMVHQRIPLQLKYSENKA